MSEVSIETPLTIPTSMCVTKQKNTGNHMSNHKNTMNPDKLSQVAENYLLSLYILSEEHIKATPAHLAEHLRSLPASEGLGTSLPSVLGMLRRMSKEGLLTLGSDKEVKLTNQGLIAAKNMIRRHRLAERLIVDLLGLELDKAHIEAHRLEHAISPEMESRIDELLGYPTTCPFGGPIPDSGYTPPNKPIISLRDIAQGEMCTVIRVPEEDQQLLHFLVTQNILPNEHVEVVESSVHKGIIIIKTTTGEGAIGHNVAGRIWVTRT